MIWLSGTGSEKPGLSKPMNASATIFSSTIVYMVVLILIADMDVSIKTGGVCSLTVYNDTLLTELRYLAVSPAL